MNALLGPSWKTKYNKNLIFNSSGGGMNPLDNVSTHLLDLNGPKWLHTSSNVGKLN